MIRLLALALSLVLLVASPPPAIAADQLTALAGTSWTCRDPIGALSTLVFTQAGSTITAEEKRDGKSIARERFELDPAGGWKVEHATEYTTFTGNAPAWTAASLVADGRYRYGRYRGPDSSSRLQFDLLDGTTLRRTLATGGREASNGVVCAKGGAPPEPSLCAVHDVPATTLRAAQPELPAIAISAHITGSVEVLVSLDADSRVVGASIVKSPSGVLNATALDSARRSTYRTAIHDCKLVPSQYIFSIEFSSP